MYGFVRGWVTISGAGASPICSRKFPRPMRWMNSPMRSRFLPCSDQSSHMAPSSSFRSSYGGFISTNGTSTEARRAPSTMGAFAPTRIAAPRSVPGESAFGMALMQCMHLTQFSSSTTSLSPS